MKTIFRAVLVIGVLNLLAVLGAAAWLGASGRVDMARLERVAEMFTEPVAHVRAREQKEQRELEAAQERADAERLPEIGMTADELNTVRVELTQIDRERLERMEREIEDLRATLRRERLALDQEREDFEEQRAAFEALRERIAQNQGDAQFKKSLNVLARMDPEDAMRSLDAMLDDGKKGLVVSYLSEMSDRIRTDVLSEFVGDERPELAAELLDSVRGFGLETDATDDPAP